MGGARFLFHGAETLYGLSGTVSFSLRLVLAALFAAGGAYKMRHPTEASEAAVRFRLIRRRSRYTGQGFAMAELCLATLLVFPWFTSALAASIVAGLVSAGFAFIISRALAAGEEFPCSCLPGSSENLSGLALWRALAMMLASVGAAVFLAVAHTATISGAAAFTGTGLAAVLLGLPIATASMLTVGRNYKQFMADTDWQWVIQLRATGGRLPERPQGLGSHDDDA